MNTRPNISLLAVVFSVALSAPSLAQVAVRGGTVYSMAGEPIKDGMIVVEDGKITAVGKADTIKVPAGFTPSLEATSYEGSAGAPIANGTNVAEVEVDIGTGEVKVLRYSVAHDCGNMINPMIVDGQIVGGVIHGIGNALFEEMIYDPSGQPLTTNYGEYLLPLSSEMPHIDIVHQETPSPVNALGIKGAGEGGTIPATAAVVAAIENALEPFGVIIERYPVSPERLCTLIDAGTDEAA